MKPPELPPGWTERKVPGWKSRAAYYAEIDRDMCAYVLGGIAGAVLALLVSVAAWAGGLELLWAVVAFAVLNTVSVSVGRRVGPRLAERLRR